MGVITELNQRHQRENGLGYDKDHHWMVQVLCSDILVDNQRPRPI